MIILFNLFLSLFLIVFTNNIPQTRFSEVGYISEYRNEGKTSRGFYSYFEPRFKVDIYRQDA